MLDAIRRLCIEKDWFNAGSNEQYGKMFDLCVDVTATNREIAMCIWLCSDHGTVDEIETEIGKIRKDIKR